MAFSFYGNSAGASTGFECLLKENPDYSKYNYKNRDSFNNIGQYWEQDHKNGGGTLNGKGPILLERTWMLGSQKWDNFMNTPIGEDIQKSKWNGLFKV